jgi:hypothetical protein
MLSPGSGIPGSGDKRREPLIVVGDSTLDAAYAWNKGGAGYSLPYAVLWIPTDLAKEDSFLEGLAMLLRRHSWGNTAGGEIASFSLDSSCLEEIGARIAQHLRTYLEPHRLDRFETPRPERYTSITGSTTRSQIIGDRGLVPVPQMPFVPAGASHGRYMVDIVIEQVGDKSHLGRDVWTLPRRPWAGRCFLPYSPSRVTLDGALATRVELGHPYLDLRIPSGSRLVHACLFDLWVSDRSTAKPRLFGDFRVSDKGRFLDGTVSLFGDLFQSDRFLFDPFWEKVFAKASGIGAGGEVPREETYKKVIDGYLSPNAPVSDSSLLARSLAESVPLRLSEPKALTLHDLKALFARINKKGRKFGEEEMNDLEYLLERRVLLHGVDVQCPRCNLETWRPVDQLTGEIRCPGCMATFSLPPDPVWSFKLNSLVRESLARHGIRPVVGTISRLLGLTLDACFVPSLNAFEKESDLQPFTDLDVVGIVSGNLIIGEVKSSPSAFSDDDFARLREVARDLEPDEVVIAADGAAWSESVLLGISEFTAEMQKINIRVREVLLRTNSAVIYDSRLANRYRT